MSRARSRSHLPRSPSDCCCVNSLPLAHFSLIGPTPVIAATMGTLSVPSRTHVAPRSRLGVHQHEQRMQACTDLIRICTLFTPCPDRDTRISSRGSEWSGLFIRRTTGGNLPWHSSLTAAAYLDNGLAHLRRVAAEEPDPDIRHEIRFTPQNTAAPRIPPHHLYRSVYVHSA